MIFELASTSSGKVMSIVGSFVCHLWSQLLRPYRPRKSEYWSIVHFEDRRERMALPPSMGKTE